MLGAGTVKDQADTAPSHGAWVSPEKMQVKKTPRGAAGFGAVGSVNPGSCLGVVYLCHLWDPAGFSGAQVAVGWWEDLVK